MKNIIKNVFMHDLMILDIEGIEYIILNIDNRNGYDVYEIKINGDDLYYKMALHAIRRN